MVDLVDRHKLYLCQFIHLLCVPDSLNKVRFGNKATTTTTI